MEKEQQNEEIHLMVTSGTCHVGGKGSHKVGGTRKEISVSFPVLQGRWTVFAGGMAPRGAHQGGSP